MQQPLRAVLFGLLSLISVFSSVTYRGLNSSILFFFLHNQLVWNLLIIIK